MRGADQHRTVASRPGLWLLVAGTATLALSWVLALPATISPLEEEAFRFVNGWPGWLEGPTWPVMQLGAVAVVPVATLVAYLVWRRVEVAAALFGAGMAAWVLAKVVKEFVKRGRPQALLDEVIVRPDWSGLGFVSGHAAVAFAMATVVSPLVPRPWRVALWAGAAAAGVLRIYTAAHLPLDVIGGAGLGMALGGAIRAALPAAAAPKT